MKKTKKPEKIDYDNYDEPEDLKKAYKETWDRADDYDEEKVKRQLDSLGDLGF
jgi:hypothetical protein